MIAAMRKVVLLFRAYDKAQILGKLQELALFQTMSTEDLTSADLEEVQVEIEKCRRIIESFKIFGPAPAQNTKPPVDTTTLIERLETVRKELVHITREIDRLNIEEAKLAPWGEFDRSRIGRLEKAGVHLAFFEVIEEEYERLLEQDLYIEPVSQSGGMVYFMLFYQGDRPRIDAHELRLPEISLSEIRAKLSEAEDEKKALQKELENGALYVKEIKACMVRHSDRAEFLRASLAAAGAFGGADDSLCRLDGWIARESENELTRHLDAMNLWYRFEDPAEQDTPPVLLKNPAFIQPFETITKIFSLPRYDEIDPTPFFAPFFALFFGLCVADLGYGLIVLAASLYLYFRGPRRMKKIFALGSILGMLTVAGGAFLNTAFGASLFTFDDQAGLFESGKKIAFLGSYSEAGRIVFPSITFSLFLGFIQVALGIALQTAGALKRGLLFTIEPLSFLGMMFAGVLLAARQNILEFTSFSIAGYPLGENLAKISAPGPAIFIGSLTLLLLFNNPDKKFWIRPVTALWDLYNFSTRLLGDILSYLRLFALGLAGGLLGNAFNNIALLFVTGENGYTDYTPLGVIAMVLVLVAGHTLNFGLALLGGFVHSLRLTFVEFYSNIKFEGGGKIFAPFRYTPKEEG